MVSGSGTSPRSALVLAATTLLLLVVVPIAMAGGSGNSAAPKATASASVKKKIAKLSQQLDALKQQVDADRGAPSTPSGRAGGDLAGNYPNPGLGANTVGSGEVIPNSLTGADFDDDSLDPSVVQRRVSDNCPPGESIRAIDASGASVTCETVGGGGNPTGAAGGDLAGSSYPNPEIAPDTVGSPEVAQQSLTQNDLAPDSVGNSEIANDSVGLSELATGSVDQSEIVAGGVSSSEVSDDSLTASDLAPDSVGSSELGTNAVGSPEVLPDSLGAADLAANAVGAIELESDAVDTAAVQNGTLQNADLAAGAVNSTTVANGSLTDSDFDLSTLWQAEYEVLDDPCDPVGLISCGAVTMTIPPGGGSVLLQASGGFVGTSASFDEGSCEIREGTTNLSGTMNFGAETNEHATAARADGFALSAFDTGNAAGDHTWALVCDEINGSVNMRDLKLSAIFFPIP
jgi:hypothetical protein